MSDFQSSLAAAFAAELSLLDAEDAKEEAARLSRIQELNASIAQEQADRTDQYYSVEALQLLDSTRRSSHAFIAEAESEKFKSNFGRGPSASTLSSPAELEERIALTLESTEENYRKITARRLAQGEQKRRENEEENVRKQENLYRLAAVKRADEMMENERLDRLYKEKSDEIQVLKEKELAAKLSLIIQLEGFDSNLTQLKHQLNVSLSPERKEKWEKQRKMIEERLEEEETKFQQLIESRIMKKQVEQAVEQERRERINKEQSEQMAELKRKVRRDSLLWVLEAKSEEFQAKRKGKIQDKNVSEQEKKKFEEEKEKRMALIASFCNEREQQEEWKAEEKKLEEERKKTVALIEELVKKEQAERVLEHENGADENKINETRRIAVQVLLESQSEEHQIKHMAHVLIGDAMIDPDEEEEFKEKAEHRHYQAAAIVAEREEQERRKKEIKQETLAEQREREENIKKVTELEEKEKHERVEEAAAGKDQVRKSVSHMVAEQLQEQISRRGSAAASLRPSAANSRATSRRGSVVAVPPQLSMAAMLTAVKEHLNPVGDSSKNPSKTTSRRNSESK